MRFFRRIPFFGWEELAMANNIILTGSHIRYLLAIKRLHTGAGVRSIDIARELKLTKVSVHKMMDTFLELSYVHKTHGGLVYLTDYGMRRASELEVYHRHLKAKLFVNAAVDESVDIAICAFISELSEAGLSALA